MLEKIKGAIFDMDGTLIDSLMVWDVIWTRLGERFLDNAAFRPDQKVDKAVRTMTLKDSMDFVHSLYGMGHSGTELLKITNDIIFHFYSDEVELKKGAAEFLEYLHSCGIRMCIASATDLCLVRTAVEHTGIGKYFEDILSCADIGKGKDQPDIFLKAMECLGTVTEDTCLFEDSHIAIDTAAKIGLKTVGIYDPFNFGQEEMKKIADVYIGEGETLLKLLGR